MKLGPANRRERARARRPNGRPTARCGDRNTQASALAAVEHAGQRAWPCPRLRLGGGKKSSAAAAHGGGRDMSAAHLRAIAAPRGGYVRASLGPRLVRSGAVLPELRVDVSRGHARRDTMPACPSKRGSTPGTTLRPSRGRPGPRTSARASEEPRWSSRCSGRGYSTSSSRCRTAISASRCGRGAHPTDA